MSKHRRSFNGDPLDNLLDIGARLLAFYFVILILFWFGSRDKFYVWARYGVLGVAGILGIVAIIGIAKRLWWNIQERKHRERYLRLQETVQTLGLDESLHNFINRFGPSKERGEQGFEYRGYAFEKHRLNDFYKLLCEQLRDQGASVSYSEFFSLLRDYIDKKEEQYTKTAVETPVTSGAPKSFATLTGPDFERILYRLFEKMGYAVQLTGKTGDQGGDLVITKDGMRTINSASQVLPRFGRQRCGTTSRGCKNLLRLRESNGHSNK